MPFDSRCPQQLLLLPENPRVEEKKSIPYHMSYGGVNRMHNNYSSASYVFWKRYVGIFEKDGKKVAAKIITQLDMDKWAEENGYKVIKYQRLFGVINPDREKTEFSTI